jgi:hypothetical protein
MKKIYCAKWEGETVMDDYNNEETYWHHKENIEPYYTKLLKSNKNKNSLQEIIDDYNEEFEDNDYSVDEIIEDYIKNNLNIWDITFNDKE